MALEGAQAKVLGNWGMPSPVYNPNTGKYEVGGVVWYGKRPVTDKAIARLKKKYGDHVMIDEYSTCGMNAPEWTTWSTVMRKKWKTRIKL